MSNSAMMEFARAIDGLLMKLKYGSALTYERPSTGNSIAVLDNDTLDVVFLRRDCVKPIACEAFDFGLRVITFLDEKFGEGPTGFSVTDRGTASMVPKKFGGWAGISCPVKYYVRDRGYFVWSILHEYMHKWQGDVLRYLDILESGHPDHAARVWHNQRHVIDMSVLSDDDYGKLPWEAEADAFANTNVRAVCSVFGVPVANSQSWHMATLHRYRPDTVVQFREPRTWFYDSSSSRGEFL